MAQKENIWLLVSIITFTLSFFVRLYFIQLTAIAVLCGIKWIVDNKSTRMLIMIHDAWKKGDTKTTDSVLRSMDRFKR